MLEAYTFTVYGKPQGKARPRFNRKTGITYTPGATISYEAKVQGAFISQNTAHQILTGPVRVTITAFYQVPKSWSLKKKDRAIGGLIAPTTKPDADNIAKIICDALNGLAFKDDAQVVILEVVKKYTDQGDHVTVTVVEVPDWEA